MLGPHVVWGKIQIQHKKKPGKLTLVTETVGTFVVRFLNSAVVKFYLGKNGIVMLDKI